MLCPRCEAITSSCEAITSSPDYPTAYATAYTHALLLRVTLLLRVCHDDTPFPNAMISGYDGGVHVHWRIGLRCLTLFVPADSEHIVSFLRVDDNDGSEVIPEDDTSDDSIAGWLRWLSGKDQRSQREVTTSWRGRRVRRWS